jgi:hypothetical protein
LREETSKLVENEKKLKRALAEQKRKEILKNMMTKRDFGKEELKMEIEEMPEEKSIKCIVCHEGYRLNPKLLLGCYIYSKQQK